MTVLILEESLTSTTGDKEDVKQCCIECYSPAVWVRSTQFSGDHPYCLECAQKEKDFDVTDPSYQFWYKI